MRYFYIVCVGGLFLLLSACATVPVRQIESTDYLGYRPIEPMPALKVSAFVAADKRFKELYWEELSDSDKRSLLSLQSAQVAVSKTESSGKISYLTAAVTGEAGIYEATMDYMKYRVEDILDREGQYVGNGRVGVGLRIKANVVTKKANVNLGGIAAIGAEAKLNNLTGNITVDIVGIDSADVTNLIPLTSEIDQTSIQNALQALASIKSKLWEGRTKITPHIVAIQQAKANKEADLRMLFSSEQIPVLSAYYLIGAADGGVLHYEMVYKKHKKYIDLLESAGLAILSTLEGQPDDPFTGAKGLIIKLTEKGRDLLKRLGVEESTEITKP